MIICKVRGGAAQPLNGPLTPLHLGYDPSTPFYPHDEAKAKTLLSDAGYGTGLRIVLDVPTSLPNEAPDLARQMAGQFAKVHVTTEIKEFADRQSYAEMARRKEIDDAACFDSTPLSTYRVLREKLHSGFRGPWWQGYTNPDVDALIDKAQATADFELRRQIYRRAYRIIRDDAPWIFLYSPTCFWGVGPRAHAWKPGLGGLITL
jgi:peptide/nickel transport system substrate-binding protein